MQHHLGESSIRHQFATSTGLLAFALAILVA
jgi:hypothetical protein